MDYLVPYLEDEMIKTILWDFDGVILDSMKIKGDGFIELFKEYDKRHLLELEKYHYDNGGVSRFEKIRYFYNKVLNKDILEKDILILADKFANIIKKKLNDKNNLIQETVVFIKMNYKNYNFHIVSGAEHIELNDLCKTFELIQYFISIDGSPTTKDLLIKDVINKYKYNKKEMILIGDAMTDYNASEINNIKFYGYNNIELKNVQNIIYLDSMEKIYDYI